MNRTKTVTGILLAGGKSQRMGQDKRFLLVEGKSLIERTLDVFRNVFLETFIVVAEPSQGLASIKERIVTDRIPGKGSAGGLYTGLYYASTPSVFVAACDMPFINGNVIRRLCTIAAGIDVVMVRLESGLQPMHGIYSKRCLPVLEEMIQHHQLRLQGLVEQKELAVKIVKEEDIKDLDETLVSFLNVNTPSDFELAKKLICSNIHGQ